MKRCDDCGAPIERERLEILPTTGACAKCAKAKPAQGIRSFMVYGHKTAAVPIHINESNAEAVRQADRANRRAR